MGRFIYPDTLVPDAYNPQDWDRYSYTRNNPVNFNDPSGHMVACDRDDWACQTHWDDPVVEEEPYVPGPLDPVIEFAATTAFDPLDWMATYEACTNGDCNAWMLIFGITPYVPSSAGKYIPKLYDILKYGDEAI